MSGERIGEYELVETIGQGGMATVYKAYQPSFDRYVALKLLPRDLSEDPRALKRFQQEARMIARLEHRSILPVYAYGEHEGMPYIVMRLLEAGSLRRKLFYEGVELPAAVRIVEQVAEALDYAHAQGVVHRDLKPSNILLDEQGNAYLTDFGIAQMMDAVAGTEVAGAGSGVVGTPSYMSPEQCQGKPATPASDIYALGVILFEMVTGRVPFEAETPIAVMYMQVREPVPSVQSVDPALPAALDRVIQRAMRKNPAERYPTASALAADFRRVVRELARHGAAPAAPPGAPPAPPRRPAESEESGKRRVLPLVGSVLLGLTVLLAAAAVGVFVVSRLRAVAGAPVPPTQFAPMDEVAVGSGFATATPPVAPTSPGEPALMLTELPAGVVAGPSETPEPTVTDMPTATVPGEPGATNTPPIATIDPETTPLPLPSVPGRIVYTRGTGSGAEIMVMDDDGRNQIALTDNTVYDGEPDWSPDGRLIAFESERGGGVQQIYVMNANGSDVRQVTEGSVMASHPDWSPDGQVIAYELGTGRATEIAVIPAEGGEPRLLTNNDFGDRAPQFSPDGTRIAYMTQGRGKWEIAVMSYPEGEVLQVYDCSAPACRFPVWSPDGKSIIYNTLDGTGRVDEVWVLDTESGLAAPLIGDGRNGRPVWSGSGLMVFFNRSVDNNTDLYVYDLSTGDVVRLTTSPDDEYGPDWIAR